MSYDLRILILEQSSQLLQKLPFLSIARGEFDKVPLVGLNGKSETCDAGLFLVWMGTLEGESKSCLRLQFSEDRLALAGGPYDLVRVRNIFDRLEIRKARLSDCGAIGKIEL